MTARVPVATARHLRREQTEAERRLWAMVRNRQLGGWKFRRQHQIPPFIVDLACIEAALVVEADGGQHAGREADRERDVFLAARGWQVLRFWNHEILGQPQAVAARIVEALTQALSRPAGEGAGGVSEFESSSTNGEEEPGA